MKMIPNTALKYDIHNGDKSRGFGPKESEGKDPKSADTHIYTHRHVHIYMCTNANTHIHTLMHTYTYACIQICTHRHHNIYTQTYTHVHIQLHTCTYKRAYTCIHTYNTLIHTNTHNNINNKVADGDLTLVSLWVVSLLHIDSQSMYLLSNSESLYFLLCLHKMFNQVISMPFHPINVTRSFDSFSSVLKIQPGTCSCQPSSLPLSNMPSPRPRSITC